MMIQQNKYSQLKQNNDKFNIEVPNIKMSLSSPTNDTNYYILSCVFNYNNHINIFHTRFESIGCNFYYIKKDALKCAIKYIN